MIDRRKVAKLILAAGILFLLFLGGRYVTGTGRLNISDLPNDSKIILDSGYTSEEFTASNSFSRFLKSGNYFLTVQSGDTHFAGKVTVKRFLLSTSTSVSFSAEYGRDFVADNPESCPITLGVNILSYPCNGTLLNMVNHVGASDKLPTYTKSTRSYFEKFIKANEAPLLTNDGIFEAPSVASDDYDLPGPGITEGTFTQNGELFAVAYKKEEFGVFHDIYKVTLIDGAPALLLEGNLPQLGDKQYTISQRGQDIFAISTDGSTFLRGQNVQTLKPIDIPKPTGAVQFYDVFEDKLLRTYSKKSGSKNSTEVSGSQSVIEIGEKIKDVDYSIVKAGFCGTANRVCVLDTSSRFRVLDGELNTQFVVGDIKDFNSTTNSIIFTKNNKTFLINQDTLEGTVVFASDYLDIQSIATQNDTVFITASSRNKEHLLQLSPGSTSYLDKQLSALFNNTFVYTMSVNKNFVFVSPDLGERKFNEKNGFYEYDELVKDSARKSIKEDLEASNLPQEIYIKLINL